ncbi:hypothetical protein IW262DRAFT_1455042 [Armillaria fumosa]|nr:hypothetical protein IW262DRAFT_1455042 [Armillaria fumosa]
MTTSGSPAEAFLILTLPNVTLKAGSSTHAGTLGLECVTVSGSVLDVFLVLQLNEFEVPIDHSQSITGYLYSGHTLYKQAGSPATWMTWIHSKRFYRNMQNFSHSSNAAMTAAYFSHIDDHTSKELADYRGRFVLVNEDSGEMVGELDKKVNVQEDPPIWEREQSRRYRSPGRTDG